MIITPGEDLAQRKWIRDACDRLLAALENPVTQCYITPQEWEIIRNREPVGGCSDITEVLQARITAYNQGLTYTVRKIADGDFECTGRHTGEPPKRGECDLRLQRAPDWMVVLTDWQTLSGPGQFAESYSEVLNLTKEHPNALVWPTTGRITTDECVEWYFTEQPLRGNEADFILFVPPEGTAHAREAVMRELGDYGGPGQVYPVVITEWLLPRSIWE